MFGRRSVLIRPFEGDVRAQARAAFTLRRVPVEAMRTVVSGAIRPRTGDIVLARVDRLGYQTRLELPSGRKSLLHPGDLILVAYGDRYATDQYEAEVPDSLRATQLVATGGVASEVLSQTAGIRRATDITPLGLIGDERGRPLNLDQFAIRDEPRSTRRPPVIAVLGTSMNSGKTTTNRFLALGLARAGLRVGSAKITGTGSGNDFWAMVDTGAYRVVDFTDAGFASTYKIPVEAIEAAGVRLIDHLAEAGCDVILLEIADGIFQAQNMALLRSTFIHDNVDSVLFAAGEALGAVQGIGQLEALGLNVVGLSGRLTASDLLARETRAQIRTAVYSKDDLSDPETAVAIAGRPQRRPLPHHEDVAPRGLPEPARPPSEDNLFPEVGAFPGLQPPEPAR